jgi:hypothetical protein
MGWQAGSHGSFSGPRPGMQPRIVELEKSEKDGSVTLKTLRRAAEILGCRLVYVLVPERPLDEVVTERAKLVAERQSKATPQVPNAISIAFIRRRRSDLRSRRCCIRT